MVALAAGGGAEQYIVYEEKPVSALQPAARALASVVLQFASASVVSAQYVWMFGGTSGGDADTVYNDLWLYTVSSGEWTRKSPAGNIPQRRRGASMIAVENTRAYLYGGSSSIGETAPPLTPETSQTIWLLTLSRTTPSWQKMTVATNSIAVAAAGVSSSGAPPPTRMRHTATLISLPFVTAEPKGMVIFGGQSSSLVGINDVHAFEFTSASSGRWYSLTPSGAAPAVRLGHSACNALNNLVIFGGTNPLASPPVRYSDVHILNLQTNRWSEPIRVGSDLPSGREGHTMITIGSTVYIFGGVNHVGDILDDLWSFSAYSAVAGQLVWTRPIPMSAVPPARWGHVAVTDSFSALMMGGLGEDTTPLSDVHAMRAGCGGNLTLSAARGSFGDGDGEYLSSLDCQWVITPAVANANVRISLSEMDIIDSSDRVLLYDGDSISAPRLNSEGYTGQILPPSITSSGPSLLVRFRSDSADVSGGFKALYEAVCAPGHSFNQFNNGCEPCPTGTYATAANAATCLPCPASTYADTPGSVSCTACAVYATTQTVAAISSTACSCQPGYVSNGAVGTRLICSICTEGGDCPGGGLMRALSGWCEDTDPLDPTVAATPTAFSKCCIPEQCPGGSAALCNQYIGVVNSDSICSVAAVSWDSMSTLRFTTGTWVSLILLSFVLSALCILCGFICGFRLNNHRRRRIASDKIPLAPVLMNRETPNHHTVEFSESSRGSAPSENNYNANFHSGNGEACPRDSRREGGELVVVALDDLSTEGHNDADTPSQPPSPIGRIHASGSLVPPHGDEDRLIEQDPDAEQHGQKGEPKPEKKKKKKKEEKAPRPDALDELTPSGMAVELVENTAEVKGDGNEAAGVGEAGAEGQRGEKSKKGKKAAAAEDEGDVVADDSRAGGGDDGGDADAAAAARAEKKERREKKEKKKKEKMLSEDAE
jgi:hypothetical protein